MKMRLTAFLVVTILSIGVLLVSAAENYTYDDDIKPLLSRNGCTGCHSWAGSYDGIISEKSGSLKTKGIPIINPAKPDSSVIVWRLEGKLPDGSSISLMPMGGDKLGSSDIQKVKDWISQGAPQTTVGVDETRNWGEIKKMFY